MAANIQPINAVAFHGGVDSNSSPANGDGPLPSQVSGSTGIQSSLKDVYYRPDGSMGTPGDGGPGDPKTSFGGSPYAGAGSDPTTATDWRDFMYGRDPNLARDKYLQETAAGQNMEQGFLNYANKTDQTGQNALNEGKFYGSQMWNQGVVQQNAANKEGQQGLDVANALNSDNSAAQAQLRSGLNQSEASNLALARSGRGWGQSAAATGQAVSANAAAAQQATTQSALLRSNEQQAAGNMYSQFSEADQRAALASQGAGISATQQGYATDLAAQNQTAQIGAQGANEYWAGENAGMQYLDRQHAADTQREQTVAGYYGVDTGANLQQQQIDNQQTGAIVGALGTVASLAPLVFSDTEAKRDKAKAEGVAEAIADGTVNPGVVGSQSSSARPAVVQQPAYTDMSALGPDQTMYAAAMQQAAEAKKQDDAAAADASTSKMKGLGSILNQGFSNAGNSLESGSDYGLRMVQQYGQPQQLAPMPTTGISQAGMVVSDTREKKGAIYQQGVSDALASLTQGSPMNDLRPVENYTYRYKDPTMPGAAPGVQLGPMAQDLEKTIAKSAVVETPQGKMVNTPRLTMINTGAIGEQQRTIDDLRAQIEALKSGKATRKPKGAVASYEAALGADPELDAAAARDITFSGVPRMPARSVPVYQARPGGVVDYRVPLGADTDIDTAAARQITFPADVVASDERLKDLVGEGHASHSDRLDELERKIDALKYATGAADSRPPTFAPPRVDVAALDDAQAAGGGVIYARSPSSAPTVPERPPPLSEYARRRAAVPTARFADVPAPPTARFADYQEQPVYYGADPQEIPMTVSSDEPRVYGGIDMDALDEAQRRQGGVVFVPRGATY